MVGFEALSKKRKVNINDTQTRLALNMYIRENHQGRDNRGAVGTTRPPKLGSFGTVAPSNFGLSMLFLFLFARELESLPKKQWSKYGEFLVLGRVCLGPQKTFAPPP